MNVRRLLVFDHTALLALLRGHVTTRVLWEDARADRLIMVVPALAVLAARAVEPTLSDRVWDAPLWPAVVMPLDQVAAVGLPIDCPNVGAVHAAFEAEMVRGMVVTAEPELYGDKLVPMLVLE